MLTTIRPRLPLAFLALLLTTFPAPADDAFATRTDNGQITITGYTGTGGAVVIPDTINALPVTSIGDNAFAGCQKVTSLAIGNRVTTIGKFAFRQCSHLTSVAIPGSVTSIGHGAMGFGCTSLTSITVSAQNSTYSSVDGVLFDHNQTTLIQCPPAKAGSYTAPKGVTKIGTLAFHGCGLVTGVTFPAGLTSIESDAFRDCRELTSVTFPAGVASIGSAVFVNCPKLASAVFQGNAPTMGKTVFKTTASGFTVTYNSSASGFATPTWTDSAGDSYPAVVNSTPH